MAKYSQMFQVFDIHSVSKTLQVTTLKLKLH